MDEERESDFYGNVLVPLAEGYVRESVPTPAPTSPNAAAAISGRNEMGILTY